MRCRVVRVLLLFVYTARNRSITTTNSRFFELPGSNECYCRYNMCVFLSALNLTYPPLLVVCYRNHIIIISCCCCCCCRVPGSWCDIRSYKMGRRKKHQNDRQLSSDEDTKHRAYLAVKYVQESSLVLFNQ